MTTKKERDARNAEICRVFLALRADSGVSTRVLLDAMSEKFGLGYDRIRAVLIEGGVYTTERPMYNIKLK